MFCLHFGLNILPASAEVICLFAQFLSRSFISVSAIKNYVSGVRLLHIIQGIPCPSFSDIDLKMSLRGLARCIGRPPRQAFPITPVILFKIYLTLDLNNSSDIVMWALCTLAFFTMARKSNLVSSKSGDRRQIKRKHVQRFGSGLLVTFKWSKTIQFNQREMIVPVAKIEKSVLCPVSAYIRMVNRIRIPPSSPAFSWVRDNSVVPVTYGQFQRFLKCKISEIGMDPEQFSSHSFRRGGASWAFKVGVPPAFIQLQGDWQSDAYLQYVKLDFSQKLQAAKKMGNPLLFL